MPRKARARMLSPTISVSERVNQLSLKAALLYTWMLAHADDQGRLSGETGTVKAVVVPMRRDIGEEDLDELLDEIAQARLIEMYQPDFSERRGWFSSKLWVIQICDWWEYQMLRDPKPSRYPPPDGWQDKELRQSRDTSGRYA